MNTEEYILLNNTNIDIEKIEIPNFSDDELNLIESLLEYTRHIQEINQLFRIFRINLQDILLHYVLNTDDTIIRKIDLSNKEEDIIIINTLVINYISSAKTFTASIENFMLKKLGENELNNFKTNCLSKIYDERFSYRLLIRLRDYAQHGHLPVHMSWDKKCSFDLEQILYTPHFNHNKKIQDEIINLKQKIYNKFQDNPRIMFTMSIAEFQLCIFDIYIYFINTIKKDLVDLINKLDKLIEERPNIIHCSDDALNGFILYSIKNESVHCFDPKEKPIEMIDNIKIEVENELEEARKEFQKLIKSYKFEEGKSN